ncbi:penicillin acylase family protein [Deinococcus deserti]|uniref:Putative Penicillin acylase 2 (Penicillin acylase II) (Penicillin amidase II) (Cephalosporin acylase II) n=1 Tax=Deinococcus deserti (strain DSM 17065 / CIP 109153 / LMG 22923 / VCD115) TaxID=546414 RepID=C1CXM0_DEIDV|nr:penicillin acylase family protein [Deinococcus deserti]ACO44826.1 putative Penicillin acylase 2 precursor (Penicillin acylase II) (Penicillin amidase II) (Cephalosporin acylase II) [Deinococcus deserti VCD115]
MVLRRRSVWWRLWHASALVVLLLALVLGAAAWWVHAGAAPRVGGELRLSGLQGPVTVTRDEWGVPHIRARASDEDAVYALGFVHWQDRSWQMDFQRRVVQGRLSEVLGAAALPQDRFLRTWGFQRAALSALPALSERSRGLIRAYTAGVNAAMKQGKVALEFRILRYSPEPWTEVDSLSWSKLMAYDLGGNQADEVLGTRVVSKLGRRGLNEVTAPYPAGAPTVLSADELGAVHPTPPAPVNTGPEHASRPKTGLPPATVQALQAHLNAARELGLQAVPGKGSNNWVLAGSRTASGRPILADDPHLALTSPMLWYLADLQGPTLRAIGASIPGLPSIVIGRNDRVAWGVTNVNPDVQDLYIEPEGARLSARTEVIRVKGQPDVHLRVRESRHGPIVSDVGAGEVGPRVALKWTALQPGDTTLDAFLGLNYARNWQDFTRALEKYVAPTQSFVYADVDGNTGYYAPGRIPVRKGWDGSLPVSGDGRREWQGYIPHARLPHTYNPADGLIVSANNQVVPAAYAFSLGNPRNWAEPYRAQRITELLSVRPGGLTLADVQRVQLDTVSPVWSDFRSVLLKTVPGSDLSRRALALLRGWDGNETVDSVQATLFEAWLMQLHGLAEDELETQTQMNSLSVLNQLRRNGALCAVNGQGTCAEALSGSLEAAVADLRSRLGPEPQDWTYGRLHRVASDHRAFGKVKALAWLFNHSAPTPGGTNTVNVARPQRGSYAQTHGASYRQVIDLSDMNRSVYIGSLGQDGHPLGRHADDQQGRWIAGEYLPMSTDPMDWGRTRTLQLTPDPPARTR